MTDLTRLQIVLHPDWVHVEDYLTEERERFMRSLLNSKTHDESMELRGRIKGLDNLLRLRDQVKQARSSK